MALIWQTYLYVLDNYPMSTTSVTTGILTAAGDVISQLLIEGNSLQHYDILRSARFFVLGLCVLGPKTQIWYMALDEMFSGTSYVAVKKVVTDQAVGAPVSAVMFIVGVGVLKSDALDLIWEELKRNFLSIMLNNYKVWPIVQLINFFFVPHQHRALFSNCVALGWNTFLAWITEGKRADET